MKIVITLLLSNSILAAGSGGVTDLIAPGINFIIFGAILYFALRNPVKTYFATHADQVAEIFERAQIKKKEATARISEVESKLKASDAEVGKIIKRADEEATKFEANYKKEVEERVEKYKTDSSARLRAEESALVNELNAKLVSSVISKAKESIGSDSSLKTKATEKLLKEIR